ncbi:TetR/AcrR family transcriptional regulator [Nocardiopsis trehalosi]|jgi:AcrR family transcriptional regulator|uniref:TetR/AcrR family transcriptional regulator n=1 Tax=Nocardiopsis trehalosi TaxID=109329 RepID=UPI0008352FEB|nr:TetR family transcriptional regulator [Nocardiopsis trehalosi]
MARTGRRPGATRTRDQILDAARAQFAELGYGGATVRGIARAAGVDPALVHHYFGPKEQVFVEAMRLPYNPAPLIRRVFADADARADDRAEHLLRHLLALWERPEVHAAVVGMLRSAASSDRAAVTIRDFMTEILQRQISRELGLPPLRAGVVAAQVFGLVAVRHLYRIEPVASAGVDELVAIYAPALRAVLDPAAGDRPAPVGPGGGPAAGPEPGGGAAPPAPGTP